MKSLAALFVLLACCAPSTSFGDDAGRRASSSEVLRRFYSAVVKRDLETAKKYLSQDVVFEGVFETYPNRDAYLKALSGLLGITTRLEVKTVVGQGENAAVFFELDTTAPAEAKNVLVGEWHQVKNGRIYHVRSAFDARPYVPMFESSKGASASPKQ